MTEQSRLIGEHPVVGIFNDWCEYDDTIASPNKKHRSLKNNGITRSILVETLSDWIIKHHTSIKQIERFEKKKLILKIFGNATKSKKKKWRNSKKNSPRNLRI